MSPLQVQAPTAEPAGTNGAPHPSRIPSMLFAHTRTRVPGVAPSETAQPSSLERWLSWWSLPLVLSVALAAGLLYLFLVPPWQGPDEPSHFAYVALLDRYNLDDSAVQSIPFGQDYRHGDNQLVQAITSSMARHDFSRFVPGYAVPGTGLGPNYPIFQEVRQPAPYYWLGAAALRLARAAGIDADPYTNTDTALIAARGASLLLSLGVIALAWLAGVLLSARPWLRLLLPLTIALFPAHLFMMPLVNNDVMAELVVSALFVTLVALITKPYAILDFRLPILDLSSTSPVSKIQNPKSKMALVLAGLSVILGGLSLFTKGTAMAAALPLLALGLIVWLGMLISVATPRRSSILSPRSVVLLLLVFVGGAWIAVAPHQDEAANWAIDQPDNAPVKRVYAPDAHHGSYVMELTGLGGGGAQDNAVQMVVAPMFRPAIVFQVTVWARLKGSENEYGVPSLVTGHYSIPQATDPNPSPFSSRTLAEIALYGDKGKLGSAQAALNTPGVWKPITLTVPTPDDAERITLKLTAEGNAGTVQFDDLSMQTSWAGNNWWVPSYQPTLLNGSAEMPVVGLRLPLERVVPGEARQILGVLLNPKPYSIPEVWAFYARLQLPSFWGSFGWLAIQLPDGLYLFLSIVAALALAGLLIRVARIMILKLKTHNSKLITLEWLGLVCLLSLVTAMVIGFSRQMMLFSLYGNASFPQGRYLFVLLIPLAWLFIAGLWEITYCVIRIAYYVRQVALPKVAQPTRHDPLRNMHYALPAAAGCWIFALVLFELYCLLGLILPYYRP
jgi:hypothetical protein